MEAAAEILPTVPKEQQNKVARFLEGRGTASDHSLSLLFTSECRAKGTGLGGYK